MIVDCVAAGEFSADAPVDLVTSALMRLYKAIIQEWVDGSLTLAVSRAEPGVSFILVVASLITAKGAPALEQFRRRYRQARPREVEN